MSSSNQVATNFDGTNGDYGIMVDLASPPGQHLVDILSIDFHSDIADPSCPVLLFGKMGTHISFQNKPDAWTLLANTTVQCNGYGHSTHIPQSSIQNDITIQAGTKYSLYIALESPSIRYSNGPIQSNPYAATNHLQILNASGIGFDFGKSIYPRVWNGAVQYTLGTLTTTTAGRSSPTTTAATTTTTTMQTTPISSTSTSLGRAQEDDGCVAELETTYDDNLGSFGNLFDILAHKRIQIFGLDIYTDLTIPVSYEIYTKLNSYQEGGGDKTLDAWSLLSNGTVLGQGFRTGTPIRGFDLLDIPAGTVQAFYVTLTSPDLRYRNPTEDMPGTVVGDVYVTNEDLEIQIGVSLGQYPLSAAQFGPRLWSGAIHYVQDHGCPSSALPPSLSLVPSITSPPVIPSSAPSASSFSAVSSSLPFASSVGPNLSSIATPTSVPSNNPTQSPRSSSSLTPTFHTFPANIPATQMLDSPSESVVVTSPLISEMPPCTRKNSLMTTFEAGTGAFGNMFTVDAREESVEISTLSFHTDFSEGLVRVVVYAKLGDYLGYENNSSAWRKVADSTVIGSPNGEATMIPREHFQPIIMGPNQRIALYVSLDTADLRYTRTSTPAGSPIASDKFLSINAGVGLTDYPFASNFFLYQPRVFNGLVHYTVGTECGPTTPIGYAFNIHHVPDLSQSQLFGQVASSLEQTIVELLSFERSLYEYKAKYDVSFQSLQVSEFQGVCSPVRSNFVCTTLDTLVLMRHNAMLAEGTLKYEMLMLAEDITRAINRKFRAQYVGNVASSGNLIVSFVSNVTVNEMNDEQRMAFENATHVFLHKRLSAQNMEVLGVRVTDTRIGTVNVTTGSNTRRLQRDDNTQTMSSLDISTTVTGEYRPPPEINFESVVDDAIDADASGDYETSIKRSDEYFEVLQHVRSIESKDSSDIELSSAAGLPVDKGLSQSVLITIICVSAGAFLLLVGFCCFWRKQENNEIDVTGQSFIGDASILGDVSHKGLLHRVMNRRKTTIEVAEVEWADNSAPATKSAEMSVGGARSLGSGEQGAHNRSSFQPPAPLASAAAVPHPEQYILPNTEVPTHTETVGEDARAFLGASSWAREQSLHDLFNDCRESAGPQYHQVPTNNQQVGYIDPTNSAVQQSWSGSYTDSMGHSSDPDFDALSTGVQGGLWVHG